MAEKSPGQKTEKPTPKRLIEARKEGQIPRSTDLVGWLVVLLASFLVPMLVTQMYDVLATWFWRMSQAAAAGELEAYINESEHLLFGTAIAVMPFLVFVMVVTVAAMATQGGITLTGVPLKPKLNRLSPIAGFKRLFSLQSLLDTAKALLRLIVLGLLVANVAAELTASYLTGTARDLSVVGPQLADTLLDLVRLGALAGVVVGFGDYAFQRRKIGKQLMMSMEDIKQESRSTEGDPMVKGRRRALHAKLSRNQMLSAVSDASVVVVNPTHVAVALRYAPGSVPTVVAKGGDALAAKIRERAFDAGVPVVEARPLARVLFDTLDVGAEVPAAMYEAVAIVIAFIMRTPRRAADRSVRTVNVPASKVRAGAAPAASSRRPGRPRARVA